MFSLPRRSLIPGSALAFLIAAGPTRAADVETLAQELGAANVGVRREAAYELDRLGADAKAALPALIRALQDSDKQVWSFAISTIAKLGPEAADAVPALIEGLGSRRNRGRERERRQALTRSAFALSKIGDAAVAPLIEALKSDDQGLRAGAAKALAGMGAGAAPAIPALVENLNGEDEVRRETVEALGSIGPAAVKPLSEALKSSEARRRSGAANALGFSGKVAAESSAAIFEQLKTETEPEVRAALLSALPKIGVEPKDTVPLLVAGIQDENDAVRHASINALVPMRGGPALALPPLIELLKHDNLAIRQRAARVLGRMGPAAKSAVPALVEAARVSSGDAAIANALSEVGTEALPIVLAALRDAPAADAERLLGLLRGFGTPAVPVLMEALKHPAPQVRAAAARALGGMGRDARAAVQVLTNQATDGEPFARAAALRAIVALEPEPQRVKPLLEAALKDAAPEVRRAGAAGLARFGGADSLGVAGLVELLDDENPASRKSALEELAKMGSAAAPALPAVLERVSDPELQLPAVNAIGKMGAAAAPAIPRLVELTKVGPVPNRVAAIAALGGIGRDAAAALPAIRESLKDGEFDVRAAAVPAMVAMEPDETKLLESLIALLGDESGRVRRPAAAALAKFGEKARAATPSLVGMLERDQERGVALLALKLIGLRSVDELLRVLSVKEPQIRVFACDQLASLGPEAKGAVTRLRELTTDQPKAVREAAQAALAKIESAP